MECFDPACVDGMPSSWAIVCKIARLAGKFAAHYGVMLWDDAVT